jgi:hypothetical protein
LVQPCKVFLDETGHGINLYKYRLKQYTEILKYYFILYLFKAAIVTWLPCTCIYMFS